MTNFSFKKVSNSVETIFTSTNAKGENPIRLRLAPIDTQVAFEASRFKSLMESNMLDAARELMFVVGMNRIKGWSDVKDEEGNDVEWNHDTYGAWLRMVEAIDYVMQVGEITLREVGVIENFPQDSGLKLELSCDGTVIPPEPSETN
jgi:hypothetical protein